jgi:catechol 2,3-dioxygenase-like lactoylglutathione lyase family enzyme
MGVHHIGLSTRDSETTHRLYTEAMGFQLIKGVATRGASGPEGSWGRHSFSRITKDVDAGMIAFRELHAPEERS